MDDSDSNLTQQQGLKTVNAEPFGVEQLQEIEEVIRLQAVIENMEHALEHSPESFCEVTML